MVHPGERLGVLAATALVAVFAAAGNYLRRAEPVAAGNLGLGQVSLEVDTPSTGAAGFREETLDERFLDVLRAEEAIFRTYEDDGEGSKPVWLFLGYFSSQKEGSQVHSPKHCYPGSGWSILKESQVDVFGGDGAVKSLVVSDGHDKRLVYYWFQTPQRIINDVLGLKIHLTKNALRRRSQEIVFVRLSTLLDGEPEAASGRLERYAIAVRERIKELYRKRDVSN